MRRSCLVSRLINHSYERHSKHFLQSRGAYHMGLFSRRSDRVRKRIKALRGRIKKTEKSVSTLKSSVRHYRKKGRASSRPQISSRSAPQSATTPKPGHLEQDFSPELTVPFRSFLRLLKPQSVVGYEKKRVGSLGDGGYVMLDDFSSITTAISAGIGRDVSWDLEMARKGIQVFQFDHTVAAPPASHGNFEFRREKFRAGTEPGDGVTLGQVIPAKKGASAQTICKMNIEGSEWQILQSASKEELRAVKQFAIEFHDVSHFTETGWRRVAEEALGELVKTHQCIHVHGNSAGGFAVVGGVPFPQFFEATFVLREAYRFEDCRDVFPTQIDRPNLAHRSDVYLGTMDY